MKNERRYSVHFYYEIDMNTIEYFSSLKAAAHAARNAKCVYAQIVKNRLVIGIKRQSKNNITWIIRSYS